MLRRTFISAVIAGMAAGPVRRPEPRSFILAVPMDPGGARVSAMLYRTTVASDVGPRHPLFSGQIGTYNGIRIVRKD